MPRTETELQQLDAIELRHRELQTSNPIIAARFYVANQLEIDEIRQLHASGRQALQRDARPGDIPTPSRHHTLRSALLAPIVNPPQKGSI